jgi:hypothetical protein
MLNDEFLLKNSIIKRIKKTQVGQPNLQHELWDRDNLVKYKLKQIVILNL